MKNKLVFLIIMFLSISCSFSKKERMKAMLFEHDKKGHQLLLLKKEDNDRLCTESLCSYQSAVAKAVVCYDLKKLSDKLSYLDFYNEKKFFKTLEENSSDSFSDDFPCYSLKDSSEMENKFFFIKTKEMKDSSLWFITAKSYKTFNINDSDKMVGVDHYEIKEGITAL